MRVDIHHRRRVHDQLNFGTKLFRIGKQPVKLRATFSRRNHSLHHRASDADSGHSRVSGSAQRSFGRWSPTGSERDPDRKDNFPTLIQLTILGYLVTIQFDPKTRCGGTSIAPFLYFSLPPSIMSSVKIMIMSIGGERQVWNYGAQVQHRRELNSEFAG